ncbi:tail fiber assembly protein [Dyadobacter psychrotolerans]|uniref:Phage tail assembly chaperone-like domain-containing protein n=1 Tax=Dyadobacter psychrotolerans TaxID=2541721 RepID=A0A4R5DV74_9BACT|nr:tail fiber assembly protein [Dyadobacter psychrotolerans]TDE17727.1 hypothetical protein E0F88_07500 [Dyadobacter psychrotolerans]
MTEKIVEDNVDKIIKYGVFDEDGLPLAYYSTDVHDDIPEESIKLTDEQWLDLVNNAGLRKWDNGSVVEHIPAPPTMEERLVSIRAQRDHLLSASDWTMISDSPLTSADQKAWKAYRKALRDITDDVNNIVWPTKPE